MIIIPEKTKRHSRLKVAYGWHWEEYQQSDALDDIQARKLLAESGIAMIMETAHTGNFVLVDEALISASARFKKVF
jgi:hypothetical protein